MLCARLMRVPPAAQLYDTCPIPNLQRNPPRPGGPAGNDPAMLLPPELSHGALQQAVSRGLVVPEQNETTAGKGTSGSVQKMPDIQDVGPGRMGGRASMAEADAAVFEQAVVSINSGDSWAIRCAAAGGCWAAWSAH